MCGISLGKTRVLSFFSAPDHMPKSQRTFNDNVKKHQPANVNADVRECILWSGLAVFLLSECLSVCRFVKGYIRVYRKCAHCVVLFK